LRIRSPSVVKMTALDVPGRLYELTGGTGGFVEAVMGATIGPYWECRLRQPGGIPCGADT